jgi:hypothetical protein
MDSGEADEGVSYLAALRGRFGRKLERENADKAVEKRISEERRAGQTVGEKGRRRGPPKLQLNVRATKETRDLVDALAEHYGKSLSDVLALAAEALAKVTPGFKGGKQ